MLRKGDKVVMHTCGEAEKYRGKIWTCETDEYTVGEGVYKQRLVFLEGFSGCFAVEYLQIVNIEKEEPQKVKWDGKEMTPEQLEKAKTVLEDLLESK